MTSISMSPAPLHRRDPRALYFLVEAAHVASRFGPELRRNYQRLLFGRSSVVAKVAIAGNWVSGPVRKRLHDAKDTEIASLNKQAAEAIRQAAEANRAAEEEKLARVKIEERLAPRVLTPEQQARLVQMLKPLAVLSRSGSASTQPQCRTGVSDHPSEKKLLRKWRIPWVKKKS
jgi:hypothetical protein